MTKWNRDSPYRHKLQGVCLEVKQPFPYALLALKNKR